VKACFSLPIQAIGENALFMSANVSTTLMQQVSPWLIQQLIKLLAANLISTAHYLIMDADVICVEPFSFHEVISGHTSQSTCLITTLKKPGLQGEWLMSSMAALKYSNTIDDAMLTDMIGITPQILNTETVRSLIGYVGSLSESKSFSHYLVDTARANYKSLS
jgi:hypothetical protein